MVAVKRESYKLKLHTLMDKASRQGYKVRFVGRSVLKDYAGMNPKAAKAMGFRIGSKVIDIDRSLSYREKYLTLVHELVEMRLMRRGLSYWKAHAKALAAEERSR